MNTAEFSQRPFAAGSLIGIRSFRMTPQGVLTGVVHPVPWESGVNEARHAVHPMVSLSHQMAQMGASAGQAAWAFAALSAVLSGRVNLVKRPKPTPPPTSAPIESAAHQTGTLDCACGFYAYFDLGYNPHHKPGNVLGVIEGFGVCTVGSRGFRCSKARIKALITAGNFDLGFVLPTVMPNYPGVPVFHSIEDALAEFPLTPVDVPQPKESIAGQGSHVTFTMTVDTSGFSKAMERAIRAIAPRLRTPATSPSETPQQRALRLRRERNTGPADRRGIDGHLRRRAH